jgi:hypothetical protein
LENHFEIYEENLRRNKKVTMAGFETVVPTKQLRSRPLTTVLPATPERSFNYANLDFETPGSPSKSAPPRTQDEAIVNIAFVTFCRPFGDLTRNMTPRWTAHGKAFKFLPTAPEGKTGKGFQALTDGHLKLTHNEPAEKSAAILEVKAAPRNRQESAKHNVYIQESAQMALLIAAEPDSHWQAPLQSDSNGNEGKKKGDEY